jgi:hypothetical protein
MDIKIIKIRELKEILIPSLTIFEDPTGIVLLLISQSNPEYPLVQLHLLKETHIPLPEQTLLLFEFIPLQEVNSHLLPK